MRRREEGNVCKAIESWREACADALGAPSGSQAAKTGNRADRGPNGLPRASGEAGRWSRRAKWCEAAIREWTGAAKVPESSCEVERWCIARKRPPGPTVAIAGWGRSLEMERRDEDKPMACMGLINYMSLLPGEVRRG